MEHTTPVCRVTAIAGALAVLLAACATTPAPSSAPAAGSTTLPSATAGAVVASAATTDYTTYKGNPGRTGEVSALALDGSLAVLWTIATSGPVRSSPVVAGDTTWVVGGDRHVLALETQTGVTRWQSEDAVYVGSPALVDGNLVVLGADGSISSLDATSGSRLWHTPSALMQDSAPLVIGGLVVAGGSDKAVHAFDLGDGHERWHTATGVVQRSTSTDGTLVFAGGQDGAVHALDPADGHEVWNLPTAAGAFATVAVRDGVVYANGSLSDGSSDLYAIDAHTGELRWTLPSPDHTGMRTPSVDAESVYIASNKHIYAVDRANGTVRWAADGNTSEAAIAIAGDQLVTVMDDRTVRTWDKDSGAPGQVVTLDGLPTAGTSVARDRIILGTDSGQVVALGDARLGHGPLASPAPMPSASSRPGPVTLTGSLSGPADGLKQPIDAAVDTKGGIWVVESGKDDLAIFDKAGSFVERWGTRGSADGQLSFGRSRFPDQPVGALVFDTAGGFYVVDSGNYRVQHFDSARRWVSTIGKFGSDEGEFLDPLGIDLDDAGRLYVADDARDDVQVFKPDGSLLRIIGKHGSGPGELDNVGTPLIVGDQLYVADYGNQRLSVFKLDGTFVKTIDSALFQAPQDLAVDDDGTIFVADAPGRLEIVEDDEVVGSWDVEAFDRLNKATGVAVLPDGEILLGTYDLAKVLRLTYP